MRTFATACAVFCVACATDALADCETALQGFRGVSWGSYPPYDLNLRFDNKGDAENTTKPLAFFANRPVKEEWYSFSKTNRLVGGGLYLSHEHIDHVIAFLRNAFGEPENFNEEEKRGYWRCVGGRRSVTIHIGELPDGTHQTFEVNYNSE